KEGSARQTYRPDSVRRAETQRAIIPLGEPLLTHSSHLPACLGGPPWRLRKACACLFDVAPDRGCRVSPCRAVPCKQNTPYGEAVRVRTKTYTLAADSSLWPYSSL